MIDTALEIGLLRIAPRLILAPMSGVTNTSFRRLIKQENPGAVGLLVTEFISIEALVRKVPRSLQMANFSEEERPISIQIFGHDGDTMSEAAQLMQDRGADIIDINCGCPAPKVVRRGGGCELMRQPAHLAKVLAAVRKRIQVPLTLKIRAGWDSTTRNALEVAKMAEGEGIQMLAIHGRTKQEMYRGVADWELIQEVAKSLSIPVVGSGDVVDWPSAEQRFKAGVSGLMIGRAALANPWVFSEIVAAARGEQYSRPSDERTAEILERYIDLLFEEMPEKGVIGRLKQLASQVTRRVRGSKQVRLALCRSSSVAEFREVLHRWQEDLASPAWQLNQALENERPEYGSRLLEQSC